MQDLASPIESLRRDGLSYSAKKVQPVLSCHLRNSRVGNIAEVNAVHVKKPELFFRVFLLCRKEPRATEEISVSRALDVMKLTVHDLLDVGGG